MQESTTDKVFLVFNYMFVSLLMLIILYPLIYIFSASISSPLAVNSGQMWLWPIDITIEGYQRVFQNQEIWIGYRNTVFYTVVGTFINLAVTLPCAYALSRPRIPGKGFVMVLLVITMFFHGGIIPTFLVVKNLGMVDTVWALLLPNAAAVWNIIVSRSFFQASIPQEIVEAAEIDGCSTIKLFFRIVIPLSMPIIAVMGLFYGVSHWNQYFNAMIYLSDRGLYSLQLILREILVLNELGDEMFLDMDPEAAAEHERIAEIIKYAVMIVSALPMLIVYPFLQRFFIKGVLIGSLKG